eukprot:GFKZ01015634.1.p1 GENE.GFKZ01015634.1~~GFKZ01015634.1.p1  ORF type:complete len:431 (+),score=35.99 GFKZ01015634.1:330-1622(+)
MPSSKPSQPASPRGVPLSLSLTRAATLLHPRHLFRRINDPLSPRTSKHSSSSSTSSSPPSSPRKQTFLRQGRPVIQVTSVYPQLDQDGLPIRRASGCIPSSVFSPFLLLDHCGPHPIRSDSVVQGEAPRCGQQELTYVLRGHIHHTDSCGNDAHLSRGSVGLLTAGSGLVASHTLTGPIVEYFSIWINIPRHRRFSPPQQQTSSTPPCAVIGKGDAAARIRVLAGPPRAVQTRRSHDGKRAPVELETEAGSAAVYDIHMRCKSQLVLNPQTERVFVYVYRGTALIAKKTKVSEGDIAVLEPNSELPVVIDSYGAQSESSGTEMIGSDDFDVFQENECWCLVLAGDPVKEPVSMLSSGIVACTPREIRRAFQEYTCGSMGANSPPKFSSLAARMMAEESDEESDFGLMFDEENDDDSDGSSEVFGVGKLDV